MLRFSGSESEPNCYVSYQTAEQEDLTVTRVVPGSSNPVWAHQQDTWLSEDLLTQPTKVRTTVWPKLFSEPSLPASAQFNVPLFFCRH